MKLIYHTASIPSLPQVCFCQEPIGEEHPFRALAQKLTQAGRLSTASGAVRAVETLEETILMVGGGKDGGPETAGAVKKLFGKTIKACRAQGLKKAVLYLDTLHTALAPEKMLMLLGEACEEANYAFDAYLQKKCGDRMEEVHVVSAAFSEEEGSALLLQGAEAGKSVCAARELTNFTSRDLTPEAFTRRACALAAGKPYEVEILDKQAMEQAGMLAMLAVSKGSANPPRAVLLRYRGDTEHPEKIIGLAGKGVTYDSGGLSLKSKKGMVTMHHDMAGAAAALCALDLAAQRKLKVNVTAMLLLSENMPSPTSYRPGDIIGSMEGKSILIKSTDAEGRLLLADGMTYLRQKEGATHLIDIATLTGGAVSAFGSDISAFAATDPALRSAVQEAAQHSGELVWEMPLYDEYLNYLKAEQADLANSSMGAGSSMINAALFLREFTGELPWLHLDIAGTAWSTKDSGCIVPGATGAGTMLLTALFSLLQQAD